MKRTMASAVALGIVVVFVVGSPASAMRDPGMGGMPMYNYGLTASAPPQIPAQIPPGGCHGCSGGSPRPAPTMSACAQAMGRAAPASSSQYADGMNLYAYVRSNPVTRVDPNGLISKACCDKMLQEAKKDPVVWDWYHNKAGKATDALGIRCLGDVSCQDSCVGGPSARYNPVTRNVTMCADKLSANQNWFNMILIHELTHAQSICGWWKLGCRNCMIEEKRAYYLSGECSDDNYCTSRAWDSCTLSLSCSSLLDNWQNYLGVGWPPRP